MHIAPRINYDISVPQLLNGVALTSTCGDIELHGSTFELQVQDMPATTSSCRISFDSTDFDVDYIAWREWATPLYLPAFDSRPNIRVEVGSPIDDIVLPLTGYILVQHPVDGPNIIYATDKPLPPGISLSGQVISGTPTEVGTTTLIVSAIDTFNRMPLVLGNYTFNVVAATSESAGKISAIVEIIVPVFCTVIVILLVLQVYQWRKRMRPYDFGDLVSRAQVQVSGERNLPREFKRSFVTITQHLGSGNFGDVSKGIFKEPSGRESIDVAIKVLHNNPNMTHSRILLLEEAATMAQFDHPNIVKLIGVVTLGNPLLVLMEFVDGGPLDRFLTSNETDEEQKLTIAAQCATGLAYLATLKYIHRDIAALNILLDKNNVAKIADFGMSRETQSNNVYSTQGGQIPIRWTAPEVLEEYKFSEQSDVWSFGILMHEIWTKAEVPYAGWRNEKVWVQVLGGYRLPCPKGCSSEIHLIMLSCWGDYGERPSFADLEQVLQAAQQSSCMPRFYRLLSKESNANTDCNETMLYRQSLDSDFIENDYAVVSKPAGNMRSNFISSPLQDGDQSESGSGRVSSSTMVSFVYEQPDVEMAASLSRLSQALQRIEHTELDAHESRYTVISLVSTCSYSPSVVPIKVRLLTLIYLARVRG